MRKRIFEDPSHLMYRPYKKVKFNELPEVKLCSKPISHIYGCYLYIMKTTTGEQYHCLDLNTLFMPTVSIKNFPIILSDYNTLFHPALAEIEQVVVPNRDSPRHLRIFMHHYENGTLNALLSSLEASKSPNLLSDTRKSIILYGIASAMFFLHESNCIHGYLTPSCILLDKSYHPHVSDYFLQGLVSHTSNQSFIIDHSQFYPPERFSVIKYTSKVDVFSFGMIFYEIVVGKMPFQDDIDQLKIQNMIQRGERPEIPKTVPKCVSELIKMCWHQKPEMRPSFHLIMGYFCNSLTQLFPNADVRKFDEYRTKINRESVLYLCGFNSFDIPQIPLKINPYARLKKLSAEGNIEAQYRFAMHTDDMTLLQYAADHGHADAQYAYSLAATDPQESLRYLQMAANQKHVQAMLKLGQQIKDQKLLKKAADKGNFQAMYDYAVLANDISYLRAAAFNSYAKAQFRLGYLEENGDPLVPLDIDEENIINKYSYDECVDYLVNANRTKVNKNLSAAVRHYQAAHSQNFMPATHRLELIVKEGKPLVSKYANIFKTCRDSKKIEFLIMYAIMIINNYMEIDNLLQEGMKIIKMAAANGYPDALYELAAFLIKTDMNNKTILTEALFYSKQAALQGHRDAILQTSTLYRNLGEAENARKFLLFSACRGNVASMYAYGVLNHQSDNMNSIEAKMYFKAAALRGSGIAQYNFALLNASKDSEKGADMKTALKFFRMAGSQGLKDAWFILGTYYQRYKDLKKSQKDALKCFLIAGSLGHKKALIQAGDIYRNVYSGVANKDFSLLSYKMACAYGSKKAAMEFGYFGHGYYGSNTPSEVFLHLLFAKRSKKHDAARGIANYYLKGDVVPYNPEEAANYLRKGMKRCDYKCPEKFGKMFENGIGTPKDMKKALEYYRLSAELCSFKGMYRYAYLINVYERNPQEAAKWYEKIASYFVNNDAAYQAAQIYDSCMPRNPEKAAKLYRIGSFNIMPENDPMNTVMFCQFRYATMLIKGDGVEPDLHEAAIFFKMAADNGSKESADFLVPLLKQLGETEESLDKDLFFDSSLIEFLREKAQNVKSYACPIYGQMLLDGDGVAVNISEGISILKASSEAGNPISQYKLANLYRYGNQYIKKDPVECAKYMQMAAEYGNLEALYYTGCQFIKEKNTYDEGYSLIERAASQGHQEATNLYQTLTDRILQFDQAQEVMQDLYGFSGFDSFSNPSVIDGFIADEEHLYGVKEKSVEKLDDLTASKAYSAYSKMLENDNIYAAFNVGVLLFKGKGCTKNTEKGLKYIKHAAEEGIAHAQYYLGNIMLKTGEEEEAMEYFLMAAANGCKAAFNMIKIQIGSHPTFLYFKRSADNGSYEDCNLIGLAYRNGDCVASDIDKAQRYLKKAACNGVKQALFSLGQIFSDPEYEDRIKYEDFMEKAAAAGLLEGKLTLGILMEKTHRYKRAIEIYFSITEDEEVESKFSDFRLTYLSSPRADLS